MKHCDEKINIGLNKSANQTFNLLIFLFFKLSQTLLYTTSNWTITHLSHQLHQREQKRWDWPCFNRLMSLSTSETEPSSSSSTFEYESLPSDEKQNVPSSCLPAAIFWINTTQKLSLCIKHNTTEKITTNKNKKQKLWYYSFHALAWLLIWGH